MRAVDKFIRFFQCKLNHLKDTYFKNAFRYIFFFLFYWHNSDQSGAEKRRLTLEACDFVNEIVDDTGACMVYGQFKTDRSINASTGMIGKYLRKGGYLLGGDNEKRFSVFGSSFNTLVTSKEQAQQWLEMMLMKWIIGTLQLFCVFGHDSFAKVTKFFDSELKIQIHQTFPLRLLTFETTSKLL